MRQANKNKWEDYLLGVGGSCVWRHRCHEIAGGKGVVVITTVGCIFMIGVNRRRIIIVDDNFVDGVVVAVVDII
eukprot:scaffold7420_cov83-Skeletonema_marinoi.AAC.1